MSTLYLRLLGFLGNYEKGSTFCGPRAFIAIKLISQKKWIDKSGKKELDFTVISPDCASFSDYECAINSLIQELDIIKNQAKKFFQKEQEKRSAKPL